MKRIAFTIAAAFLASQMLFSQAPQGSQQNLKWKAPESPRGVYLPDIFLQGTYIEVGISDAGSYGSTSPAPGGFHPRMAGGALGFVADWEMNGWNTSSNPGVIPNYSGDYFLPGDPWEGFLVAYSYGGTKYIRRNCGANGEYGIIPSSFTNTSSGSTQSALWVGTMNAGGQSLLVEQLTYFNVNEARFFCEVTLTNTGTETLLNVEYARGLDPDQEQNLTTDFTTRNWVTRPTGAVDGFAEAVGIGLVYEIPLALRLYHPTAVASITAWPTPGWPLSDPAIVLDTPFQPNEANAVVQDYSLDVAVRFPSLAPGASETFLVSYVLNQAEIDDPTPPEPENPVIPVSNWALYLGILLMITFVVIRIKRMM